MHQRVMLPGELGVQLPENRQQQEQGEWAHAAMPAQPARHPASCHASSGSERSHLCARSGASRSQPLERSGRLPADRTDSRKNASIRTGPSSSQKRAGRRAQFARRARSTETHNTSRREIRHEARSLLSTVPCLRLQLPRRLAAVDRAHPPSMPERDRNRAVPGQL